MVGTKFNLWGIFTAILVGFTLQACGGGNAGGDSSGDNIAVIEPDIDDAGDPSINADTDTDGDGIVDSEDTDDDGDGTLDSEDEDDDGDGIPDEDEAAAAETDTDGDGTGDNADDDDDNDGVADTDDAFQYDASESADADGDNTGDNADTDDDNDGVADADDAYPNDATRSAVEDEPLYNYYSDTDGDGYGDTNSPIVSTSASAPADTSAQDGDCDDLSAAIHPGTEEVCGDGINNDCDTTTTCTAYTVPLADVGDTFAGVKFTGKAASDYFGFSIATAGDVDSDGIGDLLIGAYGNDDMASSAGAAFLIYGQDFANGEYSMATDCGVTIDCAEFLGETSGDKAGISVDLINIGGTMLSMGGTDIVIGAPNYDESSVSNTGAVYVISASETRFEGSNTLGSSGKRYYGENSGDMIGSKVTSAGNVNEGAIAIFGSEDLLISAPGADASGGSLNGASYLIYGSASFFPISLGGIFGSDDADSYELDCATISCAKFTGESDNDFAYNPSPAGDINDDDYDDIIVGAWGLDAGANLAGGAYLIPGSATQYSGADYVLSDFTTSIEAFVGENEDDASGNSVNGVGDVNGDGIDDVMIGGIGNEEGDYATGSAYLVFGATGLSSLTPEVKFVNAYVNGLIFNVNSAGDIDNDGYDDILIGVAAENRDTTSEGLVYLIYGRAEFPSVFDLSEADVIFTGEAVSDAAGITAKAVGDVNDDTFDDIAIGAWGNDAGGSASGAAYLIYGGTRF